jgi:predicted dehydrogenase
MWQITGAKGSLHLKMVGRDDSITFDEGSTEHGVTPKVIYPQSESQINGMLAQLDDFAMAIREGRQPETNLEKVLMVQKITDAIYESSDKGITVKIK